MSHRLIPHTKLVCQREIGCGPPHLQRTACAEAAGCPRARLASCAHALHGAQLHMLLHCDAVGRHPSKWCCCCHRQIPKGAVEARASSRVVQFTLAVIFVIVEVVHTFPLHPCLARCALLICELDSLERLTSAALVPLSPIRMKTSDACGIPHIVFMRSRRRSLCLRCIRPVARLRARV